MNCQPGPVGNGLQYYTGSMLWGIAGSILIGGLVLLSAHYFWREFLRFIFFTGGSGALLYGYLSSFGPRPWQATEHTIVVSLLLGAILTAGSLYAGNKKQDDQAVSDSIGEIERGGRDKNMGEREEHEHRLERLQSRLVDLELSLAEDN